MTHTTQQTRLLPPEAALAIDAVDLDIRGGMRLAADLGFQGIGLAADHPVLNSPDMGQTARRHFLHTLQSLGLALRCLRTGAGAQGAFSRQSVDNLVRRGIAAMQLAHDFKCRMVSLYVGEPDPVGADNDAATLQVWKDALSAMAALAELADRTGIRLAILSGNIDAENRLISHVNTRSVRGGLDTMRLLLAGGNPADCAQHISGGAAIWICCDGRRTGHGFSARRLGEGQADPQAVIQVLRDSDSKGLVLLDPRHHHQPGQAAEADAQVLRTLLNPAPSHATRTIRE